MIYTKNEKQYNNILRCLLTPTSMEIIVECVYMGMDQYLLTPFLVG
jgi:hypothetical protein